jgi:hypothetical protein
MGGRYDCELVCISHCRLVAMRVFRYRQPLLYSALRLRFLMNLVYISGCALGLRGRRGIVLGREWLVALCPLTMPFQSLVRFA